MTEIFKYVCVPSHTQMYFEISSTSAIATTAYPVSGTIIN